jgi:hypothetical protein
VSGEHCEEKKRKHPTVYHKRDTQKKPRQTPRRLQPQQTRFLEKRNGHFEEAPSIKKGEFLRVISYANDRKTRVAFMGEIGGIIPNDAVEKFRQLAMKKYGYGKGSLSKAIEEALTTWIKINDTELLR